MQGLVKQFFVVFVACLSPLHNYERKPDMMGSQGPLKPLNGRIENPLLALEMLSPSHGRLVLLSTGLQV